MLGTNDPGKICDISTDTLEPSGIGRFVTLATSEKRSAKSWPILKVL